MDLGCDGVRRHLPAPWTRGDTLCNLPPTPGIESASKMSGAGDNLTMLIKKASDIRSSEITPKGLYLRRREFIQASTMALVGAGVAACSEELGAQGGGLAKLANVKKGSPLSLTSEQPNTYDQITSYNNFYEFGTGKDEPKANAKNFKAQPWKIAIEGEVAKPASYNLEDFIKDQVLEERIYRFRCVEAWSMIVPWVGIPLKSIIDKVQPTAKATYVEFETLLDPSRMPYQRSDILPWPYREGLRLDEAKHPLTILAVGLYGEVLPNQNGAPLRLIVPWKYGFKGIKSIVKMKFTDRQPKNTWQVMAPSEYGFYANVNPAVDHPRWSQARERRLPAFFANTRTLPFNGYADQVQSLYSGLDLRKNF
jgi:methionine sulfoxide reductase catalytic subunit